MYYIPPVNVYMEALINTIRWQKCKHVIMLFAGKNVTRSYITETKIILCSLLNGATTKQK